MPFYHFVWSNETIEHLAEHGVTPDDFEDIVCHSGKTSRSRSRGRLAAFGYADDGRYLICLYELAEDGFTVIPATAYEVED